MIELEQSLGKLELELQRHEPAKPGGVTQSPRAERAHPGPLLESECREQVPDIDFEMMLSDLSARFVNVPSELLDREIEDAQRRVCECLGLDWSALWQWSPEHPRTLKMTHLYRPLGGSPVPENMAADEYFPWIQRQVLAGKTVSISSMAALPEEAARDKEVFAYLGVKTTLTLPISTGGDSPFGAISFNDMQRECEWPEALVKRLHLVAQIFSNALARRRSDQLLRESEARLASAIDIAALGFYQLGSGLRAQFLDDRCRALVGIPQGEEERIREYWLKHIHPDDRSQVLHVSKGILEGKLDKFALEYRYLHPTEGMKWYRHLSRVLDRNGAGQAANIVGVLQDISERKHAEEELNRLHQLLWHADRVAQTAAVTTSLMHELNQPLAAILSNAQAGLRFFSGPDPDLEEIIEILTDIVLDDKRAASVVSGLRDLLLRRETRREKTSLAETIQWVVKLLSSDFVSKQIQLGLHLEPDFHVLADKVQLQQVILNLVLNAVEAMQGQLAGQKRMEVALASADAREVLVSIGDSGPGIPEDRRGKMFEAFASTKENGLGIGLVISRSIIESHNGRLWYVNNPDRGVTFYIALPAIVESEACLPSGK